MNREEIETGDFLKKVGDDEKVLQWLGSGLKDTILKNLVILLQDKDLEKEIVDATNILLQAIAKNITGRVDTDGELSIRKGWRIVCDKIISDER